MKIEKMAICKVLVIRRFRLTFLRILEYNEDTIAAQTATKMKAMGSCDAPNSERKRELQTGFTIIKEEITKKIYNNIRTDRSSSPLRMLNVLRRNVFIKSQMNRISF